MRIADNLIEYLGTATELPQQIDIEQAVRQIVELHRKQRGATFSLYFGDVSGQPLYAVSVFNRRTKQVFEGSALASFVRRFIKDNLDLLSDPRNTVGTQSRDRRRD